MRRAEGRAIVEGPHVIEAYVASGLRPVALMATEEGLARHAGLVQRAGTTPVVLAPSAFKSISDAETPQGLAAEIEIPKPRLVKGDYVFLEALQDPGNVGAILRSAAAFGVGTVVLDRACADPWSPKVLRAGMGGHFQLSVQQVSTLAQAAEGFAGRLVCTVARGGQALRSAPLAGSVGWVFGSEGAGVSEEMRARAALQVTVPVAPGTESLNVAAAAAVCLYERFSRPGGRS